MMTEKEMWQAYVRENPMDKDTPYEAWQYGSDDPDLLARLTVSGEKTATASAHPCYEYEKCDLPKAGGLNLILYADGSAACVTKTERVSVVPFDKVSAEHAFKEGEGDKSLDFWRSVHEMVFIAELAEIGYSFSKDMLVVLEEFKVVYPK